MGFETQDYDEYGSSMPPEIPGEYDRIIDSIDTKMTPDTGECDRSETQIVADALGSLGLGELGQNNALGEMIPSGDEGIAPVEAQNDGQEPPAETPEVPIAAKPVVEVVEPSSARQVEVAEAATVQVGDLRCVSSCISSGLVYGPQAEITPEQDQVALQSMIRERQILETMGEPPGDENVRTILKVQEVIVDYAKSLGVDIGDRLQPPELYRFVRQADILDIIGRRDINYMGVSIPGIGVLINGDVYKSSAPSIDLLYTLAHETAHQVSLAVISRYRIDESGMFLPQMTYPYNITTPDESGVRRVYSGFAESVTDLVAMKSVGLWPSFVRPIDMLLHGVIVKTAEQLRKPQVEVAEALAKGLLTGDMEAPEAILQTMSRLRRRASFARTTDTESYEDIRRIACQLDLPVTVDLVDKRLSNRGEVSGLFNWR